MSATLIEHRGVVQRVEAGRALVAMERTGCLSCGQAGHCGLSQLSADRPAILLTLPARPGLQAGDPVRVALPAGRLTLSACLGYLFPALAMLGGAGLGALSGQGDTAAALGAMTGFVTALVMIRAAVSLLPGLWSSPTLIPLTDPSPVSLQESDHAYRSPL